MAILYDSGKRIFKLDTCHTTYMIGVTEEGYVAHIYYGRKVAHTGGMYLLRLHEYPQPLRLPREKGTFLNALPFEYPTAGVGDYREAALDLANEQNQHGTELFYDSYSIEKGKPQLTGLPSAFPGKDDGVRREDGMLTDMVETLSLFLVDPVLGVKVTLLYSVFPKEDVITRSALIRNDGSQKLVLTRALSASIDMDDRGFEAVTLAGNWARERRIQQRPLNFGKTQIGSTRGETSHQAAPFMALVTPGTTQDSGEVYAMQLIYSGNHTEVAEKSQFSSVRLITGIHPENFAWRLGPGECFQTPEAALTYSAEGLGQMTRSYHDFIRGHIIRSPWKDKPRPVLINNWEATYFDFDQDKIYEIAKDAHAAGVEMMVMDDGWFGARNDDNCALGDWFVNETKLKGGLAPLVERIRGLGMKFGIWFEPEMISPDSDLCRAHPDWMLHIKDRNPTLARNQCVLDLSRKEVREEIYSRVYRILKSAPIDYVKWDMNRTLSDVGGMSLPPEGQGELMHRYVLGLYEMQERLITDFPDLLLENCSGGGGRFDAGMMYYSPQIWCSDDTDAIERLRIQEGTSLIYPMSTMGAHVSKCPNEQVGRVTPFDTRANVALAGTFGYELNIAALPAEDREKIPEQIARYHRYHGLVADGDYYRIHSWDEKEPWDCWMNVSKDKSEALVTYVQVLGRPSTNSRLAFLRGLDPNAAYTITEECGAAHVENGYGSFVPQTEGCGDELMRMGMLMPPLGDFQSRLYHLVRQ